MMAGSIDPYTNHFNDDAEYNEEATQSSPPQPSSNVAEQSSTGATLRSTRSSKKNATSQNSSSELMEMERKEHALRNIGS